MMKRHPQPVGKQGLEHQFKLLPRCIWLCLCHDIETHRLGLDPVGACNLRIGHNSIHKFQAVT
jgi:hypothetical protein